MADDYLRREVASENVLAEIQLIEGHEYLYEWLGDAGPGVIRIEPVEIFQPDTIRGHPGRLRPGLRTGLVRIRVCDSSGETAEAEVEVRAAKLSYLSEYRWMLRDIADRMSELV